MTRRLALVMGRQGSGKTTRVCAPLKQILGHSRWRTWLPSAFQVTVRDNFFNHVEVTGGSPFFITGEAHGRQRYSLPMAAPCGRNVLELPHAGYLPPNACEAFCRKGWHVRIFVVMLPASLWKSLPGQVGLITTPAYFMTHGGKRASREAVDYEADCQLIRDTIAASGLDAEHYQDAESVVGAVQRFLSLDATC